MREFFEKLGKIDRRIIYLIVAIGVITPILFKARLPIKPLPEVRQAFDYIESLPESSTVLISIDYDASSMPELQPMLYAILRHVFRKNLRVIMLGHWPLGVPLGQIALEDVAKEMGKKYGVDYCFLGYRPGIAAVMLNLGKEIRSVFASDYKYTPLDSLPMMRNIHNYNDIALLIGLEAGSVGDFWVQFAQARFNQKIILGSTAVITPDIYPYLQAGQIVGLIGGLRGAADYETLVNTRGPASIGMYSQTVVHILVVALIILGNVGYFVLRRRK